MIEGLKATAVIRRSRPTRNGTRVEAAEPVAGGGDGRRSAHPAPHRDLALVEPQRREGTGAFVRLAPSAPFITQLATTYLGATSGDRRAQRDPAAVAPRASGAYRASDRLSTEIEPGFLVRREF